jgi:hypothetical protein
MEVNWNRVAVSIAYGFLALVTLYEIWVLLDRDPHTPPYTAIIIKEVPEPLALGFLAWLFFHLLVRYHHWRIPL